VKVGLIGLGVIGSRVGAKLADADSLQLVYNRTRSKAEAFSKGRNVHVAKSIDELVRTSDIIVTVLSDDEAVVGVFGGLTDVSVAGKTFLDMSTIAPFTSIEIAEELRRRGASMLDVPVVGSATMVEKKEAVLMAGGEKADFERVSPLLHNIAKEVLYIGPNGTALSLKLVHNLVLGSYIVALGEAVHFGLEAGLEAGVIENLLVSLSSIRSPNSAIKVPKILKSDYTTQFSLKHMIKDLGLIEGEARRRRSSIPLGSLALQLYRLAEKKGFAEEDFTVVAELFRKASGSSDRR
jgi:3-hydroxyisobutyrate dehydrogenase